MKKKITQKELVFYKLYKERQKDKERYVNVWEFIGEMFIEELNTWGFMSYTCVHRAFEVYDDNAGLVERIKVTGKSGSKYYAYRLSLDVTIVNIKDEKLLKLYKTLKRYETDTTKTKGKNGEQTVLQSMRA